MTILHQLVQNRHTHPTSGHKLDMIELIENIFIGGIDDCRTGDHRMHVIHACKDPCHKKAVGYTRSLHPSHPNYLYTRTDTDLYLNIVDPPIPLFRQGSFDEALAFAGCAIEGKKALLIHCNEGRSRAPSIALLIMAKITKSIRDTNYYEARADFDQYCATYSPGVGIAGFLHTNWAKIGQIPKRH